VFLPQASPKGNTLGSLEILIDDGSRTILPSYAGLASTFTVTLRDSQSQVLHNTDFLAGENIQFTGLSLGTITVEILAKDAEGASILRGEKALTLQAGVNSTVLELDGLLSGEGDLDFQLDFAPEAAIDQVQVSFEPLKTPLNPQPVSLTGNSLIFLRSDIPAGYYELQVNYYAEDVLQGQLFEVVLINGKITTEYHGQIGEFQTAPAAPESLTGTYNASQVNLLWADTTANETGYTLERNKNNAGFLSLATLAANSTGYADQDIAEGDTLVYRLRAFNTFGESSWVSSNTVVIPLMPDKAATPIITPGSGSILSTDSVSIGTTTPGASLYYTLDGSTPSTEDIPYTGAFTLPVGDGQEVRAIATAEGFLVSDVASASYDVREQGSEGITLHVTGYTHVWAWDDENNYTGGVWPGVEMPLEQGAWRVISFPDLTEVNLVFSNDGGGKTVDLSRPAGEWWYDGEWLSGDPTDTEPPFAAFTAPADGWNGSGNVTLSADATDNSGISKVEFWDGSRLIGTDLTFPYSVIWDTSGSVNGTKAIEVWAYDLSDNIGKDSITVTTLNLGIPPVAEAGEDHLVLAGSEVEIDGSASYDPNGSLTSYSWSNGKTGAIITETFAEVGEDTLTLTVQDNEGLTDSDSVTIEVVERIPHRDFREETVYFIMTDRFADGDPNNNNLYGDEFLPNPEDKYSTDFNKTGPLSYYHGGDFQGIIDNLDYIQDLGFTAIWITPVVKQPEGRHIYDPNDPITGNGGDYYAASPFHGYWGYDFDQIDPHLHSSGVDNTGWEDFGRLVDALHSRGMKLMLDVVTNHGHPTAVAQSSQTFDKRNEIIMDGQTWVWETQDPYYTGGGDGNGFFSYENGTWLIDLIDFNENGENNAREHLFNVYKKFIDHGVDAFRVDTVAYMTADFWQDFAQEMTDHARSLGNDHFYMAGEAWTGDRTAALDLIYNGGNNENFHMLDLHGSSMDFPGWMGHVFKGERGFDDANSWQRISGQYGDQSGLYDPTYLATFVDNHDVTRANGILSQSQYMNNLNYIYLFRGIPVIFYGTEILYSSWPHYITTTVKDDVVARWMLGSRGINYVKDNQPALAQHLKMLNAIRRSSPALQKGQQIDILTEDHKAVFQRDFGANQAYVAMSIGGAYTHQFTGIANGTYRVITPRTDGTFNESTVTITDGTYSASVPANGFLLLDK
jgi:glycosidase